ncbi:MucR family transcriptional regulator [Mesorhizobium newzealandense]|uniref:MucR family transcriptional regulator n=1 Tax=Mesorhizobium newzealandense TaxID=1300302 RepID=A0ABW4U4Z7_9HYPH
MSNETDLIELTADIVSAYVSNNPLPVTALPELIASVNSALAQVGQPAIEHSAALTPAVSPKKSVTPDFIICLDDGKKFKSLRRHLAILGMTPDEYRAKWGLAHDYPMVAPNYATQRSELAKASGLGRKATPDAPAKKAPAKRKAKA